jgi:hypothetical protein
METDKYFIIAIVFGSIFAGLFTFNQYSNGELITSSAVSCLCLAIGFGLGGLVKAITNKKKG